MPPPKRPFVAQDFRVPVDFRETREARRLERKLGASGLLAWLTLQARVAVEAPDGRLEGWDAADVAEAARCECSEAEFLSALLAIGLLQTDGETLVVSDWAEAQPYIAESGARRASAAKAARSRWDAARNAEVMRAASDKQCDPQCGRDAPTIANHTTPTRPDQTSDPKGSCVQQAAHAAPSGGDALTNPHRQEQGPSLGHQEPQEQASSLPQGQRHHLASTDGLPGHPVELSTKAYPPAFEALWKSTPSLGRERSGRPKAYAAWCKAIKKAHPEAIASGLEAFKASWEWRKNGGEYVPGLNVWLGREVWDERPSTEEPAPKPTYAPQMGAVRGTALDRVAEARARIEARKMAEQAVTVEVEVM